MPLSDQTLTRAEELIARYPQRRSALLPILFLLQAEDGYVSPAGVAQAAELLGLTKAEVGAVATFYTMFRRRPVGKYLVSVCKTLPCELRGSREISAALGATAAATPDPAATAPERSGEPQGGAPVDRGQPAERRIGREPSVPEPTEQREAGEPQPAEGAGAAAPEAPTEPSEGSGEPQGGAPGEGSEDPEAAHEAPGDAGPGPEPGDRS